MVKVWGALICTCSFKTKHKIFKKIVLLLNCRNKIIVWIHDFMVVCGIIIIIIIIVKANFTPVKYFMNKVENTKLLLIIIANY